MSVATSAERTSPHAGAEQAYRAIAGLRNLPASLMVVQKALDLMERPLCTNGQLQRVLSDDPAATAGLLRLANSPYFGVGARIRTLAMAITVVGHERLKTLLRHLIVGKLFEVLSLDSESAESVRNVALAAGVVCHEIGGGGTAEDAEELRIAGLMHNIGEMALLCEMPELYASVRRAEAGAPRRRAALETFGASFSTVSGWLLEGWHFPEAYIASAKGWERPGSPDEDPAVARYVRATHLAAVLAEAWIVETPLEEALSALDPEAVARLEITQSRLEALYERVPDGVEELRRAL